MVICTADETINIFSLLFLIFGIILAQCEPQNEIESIPKDYLICRECGADISLTNFLIQKQTPLADRSINQTVFNNKNILLLDLTNRLGVRFRVFVVKKAFCAPFQNWRTENTWFPGYSWKLCYCPKCADHIGWMYEPIETATNSQMYPSENGFYALILNNILSETYINSLLMTEKSEL